MGRVMTFVGLVLLVAPSLIISKALGEEQEGDHKDRVLHGRDLSDKVEKK